MNDDHPDHPDHRDQLRRLNRVRGQLDGVSRMINEKRCSIEILTQLRAARSALRAVEDGVLRTHVQHCIQEELVRRQSSRTNERIDALVDILTRYGR